MSIFFYFFGNLFYWYISHFYSNVTDCFYHFYLTFTIFVQASFAQVFQSQFATLFFSLCIFHLVCLICIFFQSQFSLRFHFQKTDFLSQSFYIPLSFTFPSWSIFLPMLCFFQYCQLYHTHNCSPN